jgi:hypothetical protein
MFEAVGRLMKDRTSPAWEENDIRHFIQQYLQRHLKSEAIECERVRGKKVVLRVGSPVLKQEVLLTHYELQRALHEQSGYQFETLHVNLSL